MGTNTLTGLNIEFPIYNSDGSSFYGLVLRRATFDSVVMSLGDKITGDVVYSNNALPVSMGEYIMFAGVKYTLVNPPTVVREGLAKDNSDLNGMTKYSFEFYHPMYQLGNLPFSDVAVSSDQQRYLSENKVFSWIGKPDDYITKLNKNLENTQWVVVKSNEFTVEKLNVLSDVLSFDKATIADALKTWYDTWEIPYVVDTIDESDPLYAQGKRFKVVMGLPSNEILDSDDNPYIFEMGQGVGLKNNSRTPKNNKIVTRIAPYGSERNIPYGYPQIVWTGNQDWEYTIDNDPTAANSYPIYDGIVGGQNVRLIKHPFTRKTLMPSIYTTLVNKKVNPNATGYDPTIELVDYYDATSEEHYPNPINPLAPSYEAHEFSDIYPRLDEKSILSAEPYDTLKEQGVDGYVAETAFLGTVLNNSTSTKNSQERTALLGLYNALNSGSATYHAESQSGDDYQYVCDVTSDADFYYVKYKSSNINYDTVLLKTGHTVPVASSWNDKMDDEGNYVQSYFKITLPLLNFDMYACASITEEMKIYMRSGACIGCTFNVAVDWDDYKKNFYDEDGKFAPEGSQRDLTKYPKTNEGSVTIIVQKDIDTFGTLMPNIYQQPASGDEFVVLGISLPLTYITDAEAELDTQSKQYMLENNVYYYEYPLKFDEHFLAKNTDILRQIKPNSIVRFKYNGEQDNIVLYVKQMTVKYGQGVLPQYDITVTDDIEVVLNKIGQVTDDVSRMQFDIARLMQLYTEGVNIDAINRLISEKLSKIEDDTAQGFIRFMQGIQVGERFVSGILGEGGVFRRNADGKVYLETDNLYVRMKAYFDTVEVRHYKHSTGNRIASNAGIHCSRVVWIDASGNQTEDIDSAVKFRCYFRATDGEDTVANYFVAASNGTQDLAFCDKTTVESGVNNRRYWRAVVGKNAVLTDDGEAWIDLSKSDCESGSDIPMAGDDIIQLGNKTDTERQGAIIEYVNGNDAPSYHIYQFINSYSLENKNIIRIGFDSGTGRAEMNVYGDAYIGDPNGSTFVKYDQAQKKLEIKAEVSIQSTFGGQTLEERVAEYAPEYDDSWIQPAIDELQDQIDGAIETYYIEGAPALNLPPVVSTQQHPYDDPWLTGSETQEERTKILNNHVGDLYYDKSTGHGYRFLYDDSSRSFVWVRITDEDIEAALEAANNAQTTADGKMTIYSVWGAWVKNSVNTLKVGDLFIPANDTAQGGVTYKARKVYKCTTAGQNSFSEINYTDDSALDAFKLDQYVQQLTNGTITTNITKAQNAANAAKQAADDAQEDADAAAAAAANAKTAADNAQVDATAANNRLNGWANDGSISPTEKTSLKLEWENVKKEYAQICNDADKYGVSKTAFETAYSSANSAFQKYTAATPENITIGSDYTNIAAYYAARQTILDAITTAAKKVATDAQTKADSAYALADSAKDAAQAADSRAAALEYLKIALNQKTDIEGGLILTSLIAMRDGSNNIWSGISGTYQTAETGTGYKGHGIAAWFGGAMVDHEVSPSVLDYAKSLFRFDGSGYLAGGNITWDKNGNASIKGELDARISGVGGWLIAPRINSSLGVPAIEGYNNSNTLVFSLRFDGDENGGTSLHDGGGLYMYDSYGLPISSYTRSSWEINYKDTSSNTWSYMVASVNDDEAKINGFYQLNQQSEQQTFILGVDSRGIILHAQKWPALGELSDTAEDWHRVFVDGYGLVRVKGVNDNWSPSGGGGGGGGTVTSISTGTGLTGGTITTSGTISINSTYQTYISNGNTAYGWGNHANAGYLTSNSLSGYATQSWVTSQLSNYLPLTGGTVSGSIIVNEEISTYSLNAYTISASSIYIAGSGVATKSWVTTQLGSYNPTANFKTINNNSIIGTGNINIEGGGGGAYYDAEIEYIKNPSQAYIDTEFYYQTGHNVSYILDYTVVGSVNGQSYFGSRNGATASGNGWSGIPYVGDVYVGTTHFGTFNAATNTRYTLDVSISNNGTTCSFTQQSGGSTVASNSISITTLATMNNSIVLFADQYNSGVTQYCTGIRVHSFKIIDNGTTVRDYIPVRVGNVGYLYDKVSGRLFGNAGTDSFVLGSDKEYATQSWVTTQLGGYNPTTNFKTINGNSIIGTGNINIQGGGGTPYDAEIEYIESTGTQWINTQYIPTTNTKAEMRCNITPYTRYDTPFGSRTAPNSGSFLIFARYGSNNNAYYDFGNGESVIGADTSNYGNDITISLSNTQAIFGNKSVSYSRTLSSSYPIYLFNLNQSNAIYTGNVCACVMKLYSFKLYENNTIVRDFIPVRVGNVGYLYDKVSGQLFGNSGTGSFVLGADKEYLPLTGGTITGNLTVNGNNGINFGTDDDVYIKREYSRLLIINEAGNDIIIGDYDNRKFTSIVNDLQGGTTDSTYRSVTQKWLIRHDGDAYFKSVSQTSDLRRKTIMGDVPMNLYNVANAPLFKFTWNDEKKYSGQHIGSAAQYWQTVLPELVSIGRDADMTLAMQYDVIALASAITIAKTVVSHEERIKVLENENKSLKKEIELLKNKS